MRQTSTPERKSAFSSRVSALSFSSTQVFISGVAMVNVVLRSCVGVGSAENIELIEGQLARCYNNAVKAHREDSHGSASSGGELLYN